MINVEGKERETKQQVAIKKEWTMGREIPDSLGRKQKTYLINNRWGYKIQVPSIICLR
jgi:hypothetical protein